MEQPIGGDGPGYGPSRSLDTERQSGATSCLKIGEMEGMKTLLQSDLALPLSHAMQSVVIHNDFRSDHQTRSVVRGKCKLVDPLLGNVEIAVEREAEVFMRLRRRVFRGRRPGRQGRRSAGSGGEPEETHDGMLQMQEPWRVHL